VRIISTFIRIRHKFLTLFCVLANTVLHAVVSHGPFRASDPEYKGSRYNVLVEWENGEITSEPLNIFGKDDPVTCTVYACEHGLLEEEGWK
jgi:hypothetical protein